MSVELAYQLPLEEQPLTNALSEKPPLGKKRPRLRLVWENPNLSVRTQKEKSDVKPDTSYGRVHYNYFRDYDPTSGRYITSDPIELAGGINLYVYVLNNPLYYSDPYGLAPPKNIPPGVSIQNNISKASQMSPKQFYDAVRNKGTWDYKQGGKQYQDFGNYNFGISGSAAGFPADALLRGAGWAQQRAKTSEPKWGNPWGGPPYGDDPADQDWIKEGIKDFKSKQCR